MGDKSLPGTRNLSRMKVKRKGLTGASAMGRECPRQILGMLEEVTALVGGRWCIPYLKSEHFFALNQQMRRFG
jgi:hypothetical protein